MATDKIRKYVLPNIPYLFIGWFCLKIGTAYRLAAGAGFGEKLLGLGQTIGAAFASFAPGLAPLDWFVGIVGAVGFRLLIYCKAKKAKKFRRDAEFGTARWGNEKDIKPFIDPKFENNVILTGTEFLTMNTRPKIPANAHNADKPIQRGKTGCKVSKGRTNRLAQPDELMCKIVTLRQPVGCPQLEERPQDEQIGNVWNEIFSDLICPHGPPPLHVLSASAFLWKADPPPVAVVLGWEHGSILLCLTPSGNTQKSRRSSCLPVQP